MKIDIHVHTKKTKQGDAFTRNVDAKKFHEIISSTEVKITAITNHNVFDFIQYEKFVNEVGGDFQIWPGVELDVLECGRRGHLLVIVSPSHAHKLEQIVKNVSGQMTPDNFNISISGVIENFDILNPLYVAHYKKKKPDLIDEDIEKIVSATANKNRVLKEASNSVSAGIFVSHGHSSIYGSDVQNWDKYQSIHAPNLPDLRLPVESFEQFCLLLDKDQKAIDTLLDKKYPEEISIKPFKNEDPLQLTVYDDINILFGAKGTGKSEILAAIAAHYSSIGRGCRKFESGSEKLDDVYDLSGKQLHVALENYGIAYCNQEIESIRLAQEVNVTSISRYKQFYSQSQRNKKANNIKIKDFPMLSIAVFDRDLENVRNAETKVNDFMNFLNGNEFLSKVLDGEKIEVLMGILREISVGLDEKKFQIFLDGRTAKLFNGIVETFKSEVSRKTGVPSKPGGTGFREYASNRLKIEVAASKILENISKTIEPMEEYVGNLDDKGQLYCRTEVVIQDGNVHSGRYKAVRPVKKNPQKRLAALISRINEEVYSGELFNLISNLNDEEDIDSIPTILELLVFDRYFTINDERYIPSSGEACMILLHKELRDDKDIYILDEPERSLGNEYISNVIVPLIKDKAKSGKKIFIATHDANIAVRTLPYNSIYRHHDQNGYSTYVGNPFSNNLVEIRDSNKTKDWKEVSMKTLEGGKEAFGERGKIYGNL